MHFGQNFYTILYGFYIYMWVCVCVSINIIRMNKAFQNYNLMYILFGYSLYPKLCTSPLAASAGI